jgi:pSer/pThr/pTyr-binding forkhead associated (FHA) protein
MIRIAIFQDGEQIKEFEATPGTDVTIGRAQGCLVHLDEASISRLHAVIRSANGGWVLERKANFGAVLLNGQEVENAQLEGGEEIAIGKFSLRVNIESEQALQVGGGSRSLSANSMLSESGEGDGRTKMVSTGVAALFRFEPGMANIAEFLLDKDLAVFGRASNCDVVIIEKKASRKHFEVRRQGLSFFLKDLNSANGTMVNGNKVAEVELVAGDVIQIGESKIQFSVENKDFFNRQDQFLPVPSHLTELAPMGGAMDGMGQMGMDGAQPELGPDGQPLPPPQPELSSTDFIGRLNRWWFSIPKPQRTRYLVIVVVGLLVMGFLGTPDEDVKPKKHAQTNKGGNARSFENLTEEKQKFVKENYKLLLDAHERKDYQKMLDAARNVLTYVDDYNETKSYEAMAKRGIDQIEEEKRKKALEEKMAALKREVDALVAKGEVIFKRALTDPKERPLLQGAIQDVYAKDPNNTRAGEWKAAINAKIEEEKREAEAIRAKEEKKQKAEEALAAVERTYKAEKYLQAIAEADKLSEVDWQEKDWLDRVEKLKVDIRAKLASIIDPLLADAKAQRGEGGDLVIARNRYNQVLKVDPSNNEAKNGLNEIRDILMMRAKRFYVEAVLAESISDLQEAKDKFEKCLRTAPDDEGMPVALDYRKRCKRKLVKFEAFTPEGGVKTQ